MKTRIGTILATVTIRLMAAASFTPLRMRKKNDHRPTEERTMARTVSPSPSAGAIAPMVDMMSTQYVTLPTQALAQQPKAEKKPRYSPKPAFAYAWTPASRSDLLIASRWKTKASISMPVPATAQAIRAPATPVSWANRLGSENTPAPTIEPTTMVVSVSRVSLAAGGAWVSASTCVMGVLRRRASSYGDHDAGERHLATRATLTIKCSKCPISESVLWC